VQELVVDESANFFESTTSNIGKGNMAANSMNNSMSWSHRDEREGEISDYRDTDGVEKNRDIAENASASPSGPDGQNSSNWNYVERCILASLKGFAIGSGLRGGLALVTIFTRLRKRKPR
jgi:hypothetical protein